MAHQDRDQPTTIPQRARAFLSRAIDAEGNNRQLAKSDISFSHGNQWPVEMMNQRTLEARPALTINKTDAFIRQVCNQQRQQRPRIKVQPVSGGARKKLADIIGGIIRHIEVSSNADTAYDMAFEGAVRGGWGYWRVHTKWSRGKSFEQDLCISPIQNQFSVYFDPASILPDGSDAMECLIALDMRREDFRREYPKADIDVGFTGGGEGDTNAWITNDTVRVAEYYRIEVQTEDLLQLSNGMTVWGDEAMSDEMQHLSGIQVVRIRKNAERRRVKWYKIAGDQILEKSDIPISHIPIVRVVGNQLVMDGRMHLFGLVRTAIDPQRMYNYWRSSQTETVGLAPKAKWLMGEGQDEGYEDEWQQANLSARPVLHYRMKMLDDKPAPPPQRIEPEPPPIGMIEAAQSIDADLSSVLGVVDPAQRIDGNVSGKALNGQAQQSENAVFNFYDNLTRSIRWTGMLLLEYIPHVYDTERMVRIIGDDGKPRQVVINKLIIEQNIVDNDVTDGEYGIVMDTGPGYNTKRQEGVEAMAPMFGADPELRKIAGDIFFRMQDWPGAEQIADRLAAANPLANVDEESPVPPQAQLQILNLQEQLKAANAELEKLSVLLKSRADVESMKQAAQTHRETLKINQEHASDVMWSQEERDQFEQVARSTERKHVEDNFTRMTIAEMQGTVQLLIARMEQQQKAQERDHAERVAKLVKPKQSA